MSQTRMRSEREGRKDKSAGLLTRLDQGKHTKRRASPTSFYLPIDDRFRLTVDERCWRIEKRHNDDQWRPVEYHTSLEAAVNRLSGRLLRTSNVRCLARCRGGGREHRKHADAGACTTFLRSAANRVIQHIRRGSA
jgi:hypothetical protein